MKTFYKKLKYNNVLVMLYAFLIEASIPVVLNSAYHVIKYSKRHGPYLAFLYILTLFVIIINIQSGPEITFECLYLPNY